MDWVGVRKEYETTNITLNELAEKHGIKYPTIKSRKQRQKWSKDASKKAASKKKKDASRKKDSAKPGISRSVLFVQQQDDELTEKQRFFCLYYVKSFNATAAAIKAGYSNNSASEIGYQLLQKPSIRKEVERLKTIRRQSIMITEDDIVERYMRIAFADMTDFTEFGTEYMSAVDAAGNILIDKNGSVKVIGRNYLNFKDHERVDGGLICEISLGRSGMKMKLEDRQKALDWLSNYFNMNPMSKNKQWYDREKLRLDQDALAHRKKMDETRNW